MLVHMVCEHAGPTAAPDGQDTPIAALAGALTRRGHQVTVFTRRDSPALPPSVRTPAGFVVEHIDTGSPHPDPEDTPVPGMRAFARHLTRRWLTAPPDVVHGHLWTSGWAALPGAGQLGIPLVQTFHTPGSAGHRHPSDTGTGPPERHRLEPLVARRAQAVITTCDHQAEDLYALGVHPARLEIVPRGVDLDRFRPHGPAAPRTERPRVLSVGHPAHQGPDTVLEAMALLPEAELLIVGGTPPTGADHGTARRRAAAERHGIADRVLFLDAVAHEELPALLRSADVVADVPCCEPCGTVALEAMACGIPVVAAGGHPGTVVDGATGLLVPPHDPQALATALHRLLHAPHRRRTLGEAAARRVRARHSWDRVAAVTEAVHAKAADRAAVPMGETSP